MINLNKSQIHICMYIDVSYTTNVTYGKPKEVMSDSEEVGHREALHLKRTKLYYCEFSVIFTEKSKCKLYLKCI